MPIFDCMDESRMSYDLEADNWQHAEYLTPKSHHIFGITVEVIECEEQLLGTIIRNN